MYGKYFQMAGLYKKAEMHHGGCASRRITSSSTGPGRAVRRRSTPRGRVGRGRRDARAEDEARRRAILTCSTRARRAPGCGGVAFHKLGVPDIELVKLAMASSTSTATVCRRRVHGRRAEDVPAAQAGRDRRGRRRTSSKTTLSPAAQELLGAISTAGGGADEEEVIGEFRRLPAGQAPPPQPATTYSLIASTSSTPTALHCDALLRPRARASRCTRRSGSRRSARFLTLLS